MSPLFSVVIVFSENEFVRLTNRVGYPSANAQP
jgi:hypothetical protein